MRFGNRNICAAIAAGVLGLAPLLAAAQGSYPNRALRMVVPFAAGGGVDTAARILADGLGPALGTTVVVDNRGGAGTVLGTEIVAKAAPDGYTTLVGSNSLTVIPVLYKKLPFDALRDFVPVSLIAEQPNLLLAHPSMPAKTLKDFIAYAQANPGKLTYATPGHGTGTHLATQLLVSAIKGDMVHVPYKGAGPALIALLGNEVSIYLSTFASALPHVKAGRLRAFGVTTLKRTSVLPEVPTADEAGIPGFEFTSWYGLLVTAGTPRAIVDRLNKETVAQLNTATMRQRLEAQGLTAIPSTSAEFMAKLKSEMEKSATAARAAKIEPQ